jgi:hypothetical protein
MRPTSRTRDDTNPGLMSQFLNERRDEAAVSISKLRMRLKHTTLQKDFASLGRLSLPRTRGERTKGPKVHQPAPAIPAKPKQEGKNCSSAQHVLRVSQENV